MKTKRENIKIRVAVPEDAMTISILLYEAFNEYKSLYTEKAFAATLLGIPKIEERIYNRTTWIALYDNVISGTISLMNSNGSLYIRSVAVAPPAQRKGLGKALMKHAESEALKKGFQQLELTTTPFLFEAIRLYESLGFEPCGSEDLYGTPLIKMTKILKPAVSVINKNNTALQ
ncbi:MAG TPA: GNAT family N-acetyltransferase [Chitinophagaceae bacterium]|nr:GNAT family N-acetyltransferase [Chitinophagaceae bacterium]